MTKLRSVLVWATATSHHATNGRVILWRFAKEFSPAFDRSSKSARIILTWKYGSENGLPNRDDYQRMNTMEDALESGCCLDGFAILALVSTGEHLREWTFYAHSEDEFLVRLNLALASSEPAFPIEIHTALDPDWSMYDQFRAEFIDDLIKEEISTEH